jgi:WD40 repeat protein
MTRRHSLLAITGAIALGVGLLTYAQTPMGKLEVVRTFKGHAEPVYAVAFTPDGKYLATGSFDFTVKLWDANSGKEFKTYGGSNGHTKMVTCLAVSPDGQALASGGADNVLRIWDIPNNNALRQFAANEAVTTVQLSPDGKKLALGTKDGRVALVNPDDMKEIAKFDGHSGPVTTLTFNAAGTLLISGSADQTLRAFDLTKNMFITSVGAHRGGVTNAVVTPNNTALFSSGADGMLKQWAIPQPTQATRILPPHNAAVVQSVLSNDGTQLVTLAADKTLRQFNQQTNKEIRTVPGPNTEVQQLAMNAGNTVLAAAGADGKLYLWNATDGKAIASPLAHAGKVQAVSFHPQQPQVATAGEDGLVKLWALPPLAPRVAAHPGEVIASLPTPDGKRILTAASDRVLRVWEATKMTLEKALPAQATPITTLALHPSANGAATGDAGGCLRLWNLQTAKESESLFGHSKAITALTMSAGFTLTGGEDGVVTMWTYPPAAAKAYPTPDAVTCAVLGPDPTRIALGGVDKAVRIWNITSGAKEKEFTGPTQPVLSAAWSNDGKYIAAGSADKTLHLWNFSDGKVLMKLTLPSNPQAVAFSPDGQVMAVGLADSTVKFFKTSDLKEPKEFKGIEGKKGAVTSLAYSPKGDVLYAASADKIVQAFAVADGAVKGRFDHTGPVTQLAISKDGTRLAAIAGKVAKIWNLADGKEVASIDSPSEARGVSLSGDGKRLALAGVDNSSRLYEADGAFVERFMHTAPPAIAVLVDAKKVVTAGADKMLGIWTSNVVWQKQHGDAVRALLMSPKGDQILSAGDSKTVKFWALADGKQLRTLAAHDASVSHLAMSSDASKLVSAAADKQVRVWNLNAKPEDANKPLQSLSAPSAVTALALSGNGQRLALGFDAKGIVQVVDATTGKEYQRFLDHTGIIRSLAFLPDQRTLLTASADKNASLLDVAATAVFEAHPGGTRWLQFHSGAQQFLTAGADNTVRLWDAAKLTETKKFGPFGSPVSGAAYSRDFNQLGIVLGKNLKYINLPDFKELADFEHPADIVSFTGQLNKNRILTAATDKSVRVWDIAAKQEQQFVNLAEAPQAVYYLDANFANFVIVTGKSAIIENSLWQKQAAVEKGPVLAMALTTNNVSMLTAGSEQTVKQWGLNNFAVEKVYPKQSAPVTAIALAKNGVLLASATSDKKLTLFTTADNKEAASVFLDAPAVGLTFSANNQLLLARLENKKVVAYGTNFTPNQPPPSDFMQVAQVFDLPDSINDLVLAGDNATFFTAGADKNVKAWKVASPNPTKTFQHNSIVDAVAFHPKSNLVVTGAHDGKVRVFDLAKNVLVKEILAHPGPQNQPAYPVYTVALDAEGKKVLTCSSDKTLKLYDVPGGNLIREFKAYDEKNFPKGHQEDVYSAALSPDGKWVASASGGLENVIKLWNAADGTVIRDLPHPSMKSPHPSQSPPSAPGRLNQIAFTKDSRYLVSIGMAPKNQGFFAVWNPADGKMLVGETVPTGAIFGLAFSPDEKWIALGTGNNGRPAGDHNVARLIKNPMK